MMASHVEKLSQFRKLFLEECADHLRTLEEYFRQSVQGQTQALPGQLDEAFRAIHSIKGGAGMFGLERLIPLAHAMETKLHDHRRAKTGLGKEESKVLLKAMDCLSDLIDAAIAGIDLPQHYETPTVKSVEHSSNFDDEQPTRSLANDEAEASLWDIEFKPGKDMFRRGIEPLQLIRTLKKLGTVDVSIDLGALPEFEYFDPAANYLAWHFRLQGNCYRAEIAAVFEFAASEKELKITAISPTAVEPATATFAVEEKATAILPLLEPEIILAPAPATETLGPKSRSIRVELERVDKLVNLAGEIAISQGLVAQHFDQSIMNSHPKLFQEISMLLGLVQNLQDSVMSVRAQPLSSVFERMPRLVRELSEQLGKPLEFKSEGGATEIDKSVLEQLVDPIVHLVRNAADHGIESAEARRTSGKSATGTISLTARHIGSRVEILVTDDGSGLDHARIRAKAIERNLVQPDASLLREEIEQLIFLPSFSTAAAVTTVSGRGVGMDVVRKNILQLGGKIRVSSTQGEGTTFILSLPLSLAVLEGMVVKAGGDFFVIPTRSILECRGHWQADTRFVPAVGRIMPIRDTTARVFPLTTVFGKSVADDASGIAVITQLSNGSLAAFVVDEIVGQQQVVVKQLAVHIGTGEGLSGVSILGDGSLALIVDLEEAAAMGQQQQRQLQVGTVEANLHFESVAA